MKKIISFIFVSLVGFSINANAEFVKPHARAFDACMDLKKGEECVYSPGAGQTNSGVCQLVPEEVSKVAQLYCGPKPKETAKVEVKPATPAATPTKK